MPHTGDRLEAEREGPVDVPGRPRDDLEEPASNGIPAGHHPLQRQVAATIFHPVKNPQQQKYYPYYHNLLIAIK